MANRAWQAVCLVFFVTSVLGYVDFGTITQPYRFEPTFEVPRPHQLPDDVWMRYATYHSHLTAVAPSVRLLRNGSLSTSWSIHSQDQLRPSRTIAHQGLRKRQGVFSGDPPIPTCRQCDRDGQPINNNNNTDGPICSLVNYGGIFRSGGFGPSASLPDYCFNAGYGGPLIPAPEPTNAGLPCCPMCYPAGNNTAIITSGVLSTTGPITTPTRRPGGNGGGVIGSGIGGDGDGSTITVTDVTIEPETTITRTTLSIETITPPADPTVSIVPDTIIGCGTASGCGTVVGNGTVYLAPFGFPAVTSVGTVTGCAPTVIGCGTMIATTGTFTGTADVSACGEGTGCATMIGTGTVWPAGFMDMISFVSSGTVTGCGRVKGCGVLTGTGTFTVSEPFTTTIQPSPTVNVYVSYCPPDPAVQNPLMRLAGNITDPDAYLRYAISPTLAGRNNYTQLNSTGNSILFANSLCRICPEDSGICCPPFTDCGADGHCPWDALEGCGYAMFGVNFVNVDNSSESLGMAALPPGSGYARLRAPGLPGSKKKAAGDGGATGEDTPPGYDTVDVEAGLSEAQKIRKRLAGGKQVVHDHVQAHAHGRRGLARGIAHQHGHGH